MANYIGNSFSGELNELSHIGEILVFNVDSVTNTDHATISFRGNKR